MSLNQEVELLKQIPFFANIETSKLKLLAFTSERVAFAAGEVLCRQDEVGTSAFIIMEGEAEIVVRTPTGTQTVATIGKNNLVGEIAILCDVPRTATVRAKTDMVTLCIAKDLFLRLICEFPQIAVEIMRELAQRLEATTKAVALARQEAEEANRALAAVRGRR